MYQMTEAEERFADFVWEHEPVGSGELVKLCGEAFGWKKSTTYTYHEGGISSGTGRSFCGKGISGLSP